jgi:hypothetical protein
LFAPCVPTPDITIGEGGFLLHGRVFFISLKRDRGQE